MQKSMLSLLKEAKMPGKGGRSTESEIASAVVDYLFETPSGEAPIAAIVEHLRAHFPLTGPDQEKSVTRPNEQIWEQQVRNITSHREAVGNFIREGYLNAIPGGLALSDAGTALAKDRGG